MMDLNEKVKLKMNHVKFDRSRVRRYVGNIGEMVAKEVLLKEGFEVRLLTPYFPDREPRTHYESKFTELKTFLGNKLETFKEYMEKLGVPSKSGIAPILGHAQTKESTQYLYTPDLYAKKGGKIYVVEVKTGKGIKYLKEEKLRGLMLAKDYGFIPLLVTLNVNIEVSGLTIAEL